MLSLLLKTLCLKTRPAISITISLINTSLGRRHALAAVEDAILNGWAWGAVMRVLLQPGAGRNGGNDSGM